MTCFIYDTPYAFSAEDLSFLARAQPFIDLKDPFIEHVPQIMAEPFLPILHPAVPYIPITDR